jgi:hypothetical protein
MPNEPKKIGWRSLQIFVAFFAICFAVGYFRGRTDAHSDKCQSELLLKYSKLVNVNPLYYLGGGSPRFVFCFPNFPYRISYDISPVALDEGFDHRLLDIMPPFYDTVHGDWLGRPILGVLDAGTAWKLNDGVKSISEAEAASPGLLKRALGVVFGTCSGYRFGYWQGSYIDLDPRESRLVEPFFNQKEHQTNLKRLIWLQKYYPFQKLETPSQTKPENRAASSGPVIESFEKAKSRIGDPAYDPQNLDFQALNEMIQISTKGTSARNRMFVEFMALPPTDRAECCKLYQAARLKNTDLDSTLLDWAANAYSTPGPYTNGLLKTELAQLNKSTGPQNPSNNPASANKL